MKKIIIKILLCLMILSGVAILKPAKKNHSENLITAEEISFNDQNTKKKYAIYWALHHKKIEILEFIETQWPEYVFVDEMVILDSKVTVKGIAYDLSGIDYLAKIKNKKIIVQSLAEKKQGWIYLCDIWY